MYLQHISKSDCSYVNSITFGPFYWDKVCLTTEISNIVSSLYTHEHNEHIHLFVVLQSLLSNTNAFGSAPVWTFAHFLRLIDSATAILLNAISSSIWMRCRVHLNWVLSYSSIGFGDASESWRPCTPVNLQVRWIHRRSTFG